jgi:cysteinyl-tRNA synthetase
LDDDLNVAAALAALFQFIRTVNPLLDQGRLSASDLAAARTELQRVNEVLGVIDLESDGLSTDQAAMIAERERARAAKDFGAADRLRDRLLAEGIHVIDTKKGTRWKRIDSEN